MKKLFAILVLMTSLSAVANVAFASNPWPTCYPCPDAK